jgi:actin related protein 2/3 complex subunit 1A/1B
LDAPEIDVVSCYAFSQDLRILALCPNNEEVYVFKSAGEEFQRVDVLKKHTQRVTGLSFSSSSHLVSVSEDRTGFVWRQEGGAWITNNVELKASRAPLCVSWSPDSSKFAVGTSGKDISVCTWQEDADAWVAKKVGKYKAAVGTLAWHPTSAYLASGSFDCSCHVWDVNDAFGQAQVSESAAAWINAVAFSEAGQFFAFAPNDSTVSFKDLQLGPDAPASRVRWRGLPFLCVTFVGDSCLIACGYDKLPVLFQLSPNGWQVSGSVDMAPKAALSRANSSQFEGAKNVFKGSSKQEKDSSKHTNTITACSSHSGAQFSTSGLDGQVVLWQLSGQPH